MMLLFDIITIGVHMKWIEEMIFLCVPKLEGRIVEFVCINTYSYSDVLDLTS